MSSNAVAKWCFYALPVFLMGVAPAALAAQDSDAPAADAPEADSREDAEPEPAPPPRRNDFAGVNLSVTVPKDESDALLEEDCEEEADAARITNEIVVCRQLGQASDGSWDKAEWEKSFAERTAFKGSPGTPNTFGIANHGNAIGFGKVPPPALMIDVGALPQAPEGSDADRIARGLPPLGKDGELTPEEIAKRRRALGLEAPPLPTDSE